MEADGSDMEVVSPIYRIEFEMPNGTTTVFEKGFDVVDNLNQNNFYQVFRIFDDDISVWAFPETPLIIIISICS